MYKFIFIFLIGCSNVAVVSKTNVSVTLNNGTYDVIYSDQYLNSSEVVTELYIDDSGRYFFSIANETKGINFGNEILFYYDGLHDCKSISSKYIMKILPLGPTKIIGTSMDILRSCSKDCICSNTTFNTTFEGIFRE